MGISEGIAVLVAVLSFTNLARKNVWSRDVCMGESNPLSTQRAWDPQRTVFFYNQDLHAATVVVAQIFCDEFLVCV